MKLHYRISLLISLLFSLLILPASAQTTVNIGTGSAISVFSPLNRTNDYCVYEVIYLSTEINVAGDIISFGFQRHDGTNTDSLENVSIFMKHTTATQLFAGNVDTTGYMLVYNGSFPNDSGAGWRSVLLNNSFSYNNTSNLQVLVVKGYQPAIANTPVTPRWIYTNISPSPARARRYYGNNPINLSTNLSTVTYSANATLTFLTTGTVEIYPATVTVFPNPSPGQVTFRNSRGWHSHTLRLYNTLGALVVEKSLTGTSELTLDHLPRGQYFYSIETPEKGTGHKGMLTVE